MDYRIKKDSATTAITTNPIIMNIKSSFNSKPDDYYDTKLLILLHFFKCMFIILALILKKSTLFVVFAFFRFYFLHSGLGYITSAVALFFGPITSNIPFCHCPSWPA